VSYTADEYCLFSLVGLRWALKKDWVFVGGGGARYSLEVGYKGQPRTVDYSDDKAKRDAMFEKLVEALHAHKVTL
jgi:hypothetical protein